MDPNTAYRSNHPPRVQVSSVRTPLGIILGFQPFGTLERRRPSGSPSTFKIAQQALRTNNRKMSERHVSTQEHATVRRILASLPRIAEARVPSGTKCTICMSLLVANGSISNATSDAGDRGGITRIEGCGHLFCRTCLSDWIKNLNLTCPICRHDFGMSRSGGRGDHRGNRSSESPSYYSAQPTPTPHGDTGHGSNANSAASGGGYHSGSGTTSIDENEALIWYRRTPAPLDSNHPYQDPSPLITFTKGGVSLLAQAPGSGNYLDMTGYTPDVIGRILRDPEHVMTPLAQYPFPEDPRLRMLSLLSPENSSESRPNALRRPFRFRFKGRGRRAVPTADSSCCTIM